MLTGKQLIRIEYELPADFTCINSFHPYNHPMKLDIFTSHISRSGTEVQESQ